MDKTEKNTKDYYVVDLAHIVKTVWQRIWVVAIVSVIVATLAFSLAAFKILSLLSPFLMF